MNTNEYVLYKGEEVIAMGTAQEIADKLGITKDTVKFYGTPAYKRRRKNSKTRHYLVKVGDFKRKKVKNEETHR